MNKEVYKSSFKNLNVSEKALNGIITKAAQLQNKKYYRHKKCFKLLAPVAIVLVISVITVSAAKFSKSDVFKSLFNQFYDNDNTFNQSQQEFVEKYGSIPNKQFIKDDAALYIDGIIGDSNYVYIKYTISAKDGKALDSFNTPTLYIGKMAKGIIPASICSNTKIDSAEPYKIHKAIIAVKPDSETTVAGQTATFVTENTNHYESIKIGLAEIYTKHGIKAPNNSNEINAIPDSHLNLPFNNKYGGEILLKSIGIIDDKLILAVNSSEYYKTPKIFLRNKKTNQVYTRCDGCLSASNGALEFYPYKIGNIEALKDLEIVMPAEYHFSFPLNYTDTTKEIDIGKFSPLLLGDTKIDRISISPLSVNIAGTSAKNYISAVNCCIRLNDETIVSNLALQSGTYDKSTSFHCGFSYKNPIMLKSIKAIIIKIGDNSVEVPLN